jgi:hypothetical protein
MLLCTDANAAAADLASGVLAYPSCQAGRLRPWGCGRERAIRLHGEARQRVRPLPGPVRLVPGDAPPAAVLDGAPARECGRRERAGGCSRRRCTAPDQGDWARS